MAPKVPEKQLNQQQQQQQPHHQQPIKNNSISVKHSNPFHISATTLCHNKRLKLKRSKYGEYLRNAKPNNKRNITPPQRNSSQKTEVRRRKLSLLPANVTINLLSDDEEESSVKQISRKQPVIVNPQSMCLERAAILGLMPVDRSAKPPPLASVLTNHQPLPLIINANPQPLLQGAPLAVTMPKQTQIQEQRQQQQQQPRKRKSKPQKRHSLPNLPKIPFLPNTECIVLSDDSNDVPAAAVPQAFTAAIAQPPDLSLTCSTSSQQSCLPQQNSMQVDEEVTISLVPRSLNATTCARRSSLNSSSYETAQEVFPMLPDETTVHTVIANRIYELSLTKLREGLASCGIPEFADGQQKISPQRRKGIVQQLPLVSPPQAPISLKLSSDLSISLISDDEDDVRQNNCRNEPILSPAFLQKLPVNVSIAPVPMVLPLPLQPPTDSNHANEPRKLKLG